MSYLNSMHELDNAFIVLIGRNGSGKSFALNRLLQTSPDSAIYISEEGIASIINQRNKIDINHQENKYIYIDEQRRGQGNVAEEYAISTNAKSIIEFCTDIKSKLSEIINKSQGQKKLENIMDIFLSYNFNNIDMVLFDEPENFLDEEYLRIVSMLISKLIELNFRVRISTHNSSLLSILDVSINNVVLCENRKMIQVTKKEIQELFIDNSNGFNLIMQEENVNMDSSIKYKLNLHDNPVAFENYINCNLSAIEFYSCLFHKTILIVEGISDQEALKSIKEKFDNSLCIYSANGKVWIPFYTKLFQMYKKDVIALIDVDDNNKIYAMALTKYLRTIDGISLVEHDPDMETEYDIDTKEIGKILGMSKKVREYNKGWLKQLSAYYFFKVKGNWPMLEEKLFPSEEDNYNFD